LVTGAGGLVGSHAAKHLHHRGYDVVALHRKFEERQKESPWAVVQGDLLSEGIVDLLDQITFDSIVHCAAVLPTSQSGAEAEHVAIANLAMDKRMVDLCLRKRCRLIYISSSSVYGHGIGSVITEETPLMPKGPYSSAKAASEQTILRELPAASVILRVNAPYGPGQQRRTVLRLFIERALLGLDLMYHGTGKREQDFTAAEDVGKVIACAVAVRSARGIFNITGGHPISMRRLAELVVRTVKASKSRVVPSGKIDPQEGDLAAFDTSKARRILRWRPEVSLEQGIRQWAEYLRQRL
jgi:nucleoside-diphosphate-sugar epimerase